MKLTPVNPNWNVRSLGRYDTRGPMRVGHAKASAAIAEGNAARAITKTIGVVAARMQEDQDNEEIEYASYARNQHEFGWDNTYGSQDYFKSSEVPSNVKANRSNPNKIPAYSARPGMYIDTANKNIDELSRGITNPRKREAWVKSQRLAAQEQYGNHMVNAAKQQQAQTRFEQDERIQNLLQQRSYAAATIVANNFNGTTAEVSKRRSEILKQQEMDGYLDAKMEGNVGAMKHQIGVLKDPNYSGTLSTSQRATLSDDLDRRIESIEAESKAEFRKANDRVISDMRVRAHFGDASTFEINDLYEKKVITGAERSRFIIANESAHRRKMSVSDSVAKIANRRRGGDYFDSKEDKKDYDQWYDSLAIDLSKEDGQRQAVTYMAQDMIMPGSVSSYIRTRAVSNDPAEVQKMVDFTRTIREFAPEAFDLLGDNEKSAIQMYAQLSAVGGVNPETVKTVKQALYLDDGVRASRETNLHELVKDKPTADRATKFVDKNFDPLFGGMQPETTQRMAADYDSLFNTFYMSTGDEDAATNLTEARLARAYGVTTIATGKRMMKYPPESQLPEDQTKFFESDWKATMEEYGLDPEFHTFNSDIITERQTTKTWPIIDRRTMLPVFKSEGGKQFILRWNPIKSFREKQRSDFKRNQDSLKGEVIPMGASPSGIPFAGNDSLVQIDSMSGGKGPHF